ncbi:MAG: lysine-specific demethylase, partial [Candidatus Paceibacterales bacterium]
MADDTVNRNNNQNIFHPTLHDMSDFVTYVEKLRTICEPLGFGLCKIVPPKEYTARPQGYDNLPNIRLPYIHAQSVARKKLPNKASQHRFYRANIDHLDGSTLKEYNNEVNEKDNKSTANGDDEEKLFWSKLHLRKTKYASDLDVKTLFSEDVKLWNLNSLDTILTKIKTPLLGVNTTFLYIASRFSFFGLHVEDVNLPSINYLHLGKSKVWYSVPTSASKQVEDMLSRAYPYDYKKCSEFIRHKRYLVHPNTLTLHSIPWTKTIQNPGEFIITFPYGYHQGYNAGYNISEAINFGTEHWVPYGQKSRQCTCLPNTVGIDMSLFT